MPVGWFTVEQEEAHLVVLHNYIRARVRDILRMRTMFRTNVAASALDVPTIPGEFTYM